MPCASTQLCCVQAARQRGHEGGAVSDDWEPRMDRAEFIRTFSEGLPTSNNNASDEEPDQSLVDNAGPAEPVSQTLAGPAKLRQEKFESERQKQVQDQRQQKRLAAAAAAPSIMERKLQFVFDHYARQRAWQETTLLETSAWNRLLLDADRTHSSPALLVDHRHVAPADVDIIYTAAAEQQHLKTSHAAHSAHGHRLGFEGFLVALSLLFTKRFQSQAQRGKIAFGAPDQPQNAKGDDKERALIRYCLNTYILPLYDALATAAQERDGDQDDVIADHSSNNSNGNDDGGPRQEHFKFRPGLAQNVHQYRENFAEDEAVRSFLTRKFDGPLRTLFFHFSGSRKDATATATVAKTRARSRLVGVGQWSPVCCDDLVKSSRSSFAEMYRMDLCRILNDFAMANLCSGLDE